MHRTRFIRDESDDAPGGWEVKLARKYYAKLFREYCIADLSRYKVQIEWLFSSFRTAFVTSAFAPGAHPCIRSSACVPFGKQMLRSTCSAASANASEQLGSSTNHHRHVLNGPMRHVTGGQGGAALAHGEGGGGGPGAVCVRHPQL